MINISINCLYILFLFTSILAGFGVCFLYEEIRFYINNKKWEKENNLKRNELLEESKEFQKRLNQFYTEVKEMHTNIEDLTLGCLLKLEEKYQFDSAKKFLNEIKNHINHFTEN